MFDKVSNLVWFCSDDQLDSPFSVSPFSSIPDTYTDIPNPNQSFDYGSRPLPDELDDSFRPSLDSIQPTLYPLTVY